MSIASAQATSPFDLRGAARRLKAANHVVLNDVRIKDDGTVMQSFAFNSDCSYMYVAQMMQGNKSVSGRMRSFQGDLTITRVRMSDGSADGAMRLYGFGHGVSIGVETSGGVDYLWTETSSTPTLQNGQLEGRGTKICAFPWATDTTRTPSGVTTFDPPSDAAPAPECAPSIDASGNRIAINYKDAEQRWHVVNYDLSEYKRTQGNLPWLQRVTVRTIGKEPNRPLNNTDNTPAVFQGFVSRGNYLYTLWGDQIVLNTHLVSYKWSTDTTAQVAGTGIYASYDFREPEGIALRADGGVPKLCYGFASRVGSHRRASFAYKKQ